MKTEAGSNNIINNNNSNKMDFDMYPSISSGKQQDPVREVVMKYIDYFLPESDASGTSAVAIDNKIEQAMDLVKSHLMIAVREEVEVLKERISELMDKISNLELENNILKSNMSPETLQQLQMQLQIAGSQQPAAVAAAPATPAIQAAPTAAAAVASAAAAAATSPATSAAPATILANGSAENGSSSSSSAVVVDAAVSAASVVEQQQQAATNGSSGVAAAAVSTNGPMS